MWYCGMYKYVINNNSYYFYFFQYSLSRSIIRFSHTKFEKLARYKFRVTPLRLYLHNNNKNNNIT